MTRSPPPDHTDRELWMSTARRLTVVALAALLVASAGLAPAAAQSDRFTLETDAIPSTGNATVSGTTTLDSGTELRIRLRSVGETEPAFIRSTTATVGDDGAWTATANLSAVEIHDRISVTVAAAEGDAAETFEASLRNDRASGSGEAPISTPGFGVVAAVAALLASAAVLARTRR